MDERRQNWTCEAHHELVESLRDINHKLDGMIERQIAYAETSARIEEKQKSIERIVTNGLSHNVQNIVKRLDKLDEFGWFRKPVTKLKDSMFWYALKIAIAGGGLYIVMHFGDKLIKGMVK
jgi:hypothetical protein